MAKTRFFQIPVIVASLLTWGCDDRLYPDEPQHSDAETAEGIILPADEGYFTLPDELGDVSDVCRTEGDFVSRISDGRFYHERNDGNARREARFLVTLEDGRDTTLVYVQPPATRASAGATLRQFYRHHGVGYSYNAVYGDYCNLKDFRCQILNRAEIDRISEQEGASLINVNAIHEMSAESSVYTSVVDYVQNTNFHASVEGDIILFSGGVSATCSAFEDGVTESYILRDQMRLTAAEYSLAYNDIAIYAQRHPTLLTSSFRTAVGNLADMKSVDDFITVYGTHVVTFARLGARLTLEAQVETRKFEEIEQEYALASAQIATLFKKSQSTSSVEKNYKILRNSTCRVDILGGDRSILDGIATMTSFDNSKVTQDLDSKWLNSVTFDDEDLASSNVELIDIEVVPIWKFIPDADKAWLVEARVTGNMGLVAERLSNKNFINTRFDGHPTSVTCQIGGVGRKTFDNPETVDIIAANRTVATVCKEYVPEISQREKVFVAYPVYEGRVKLTDGLCIHGGNAYKVDWRHDRYTVTKLNDEGVVSASDIYMNLGGLSYRQSTNLEYQPSHPILGCERPGGIGIDGSVGGAVYKVFKHFGHFYLDTTASFPNLPGWSFSKQNPSEASNYPGFFSGDTYSNRMVRNDNYIYLWNPTEITY